MGSTFDFTMSMKMVIPQKVSNLQPINPKLTKKIPVVKLEETKEAVKPNIKANEIRSSILVKSGQERIALNR